MKKIGTYILVAVLGIGLIFSGVYCGITWFKRAHATSHIIGSLDFDNSYATESFAFSDAEHPIAFYQVETRGNVFWNDSDWAYIEELPSVPSFDGDKNQYEVTFNKYLILEPTVLFRAVSFRLPLVFKDLDGSTLCNTYADIEIKFYQDKTVFQIAVSGDRNKEFVERYIEYNGFELSIMEVNK